MITILKKLDHLRWRGQRQGIDQYNSKSARNKKKRNLKTKTHLLWIPWKAADGICEMMYEHITDEQYTLSKN